MQRSALLVALLLLRLLLRRLRLLQEWLAAQPVDLLRLPEGRSWALQWVRRSQALALFLALPLELRWAHWQSLSATRW